MNRINELDEHIPSARKRIDELINTLASWRNTFTNEDEIKLIRELESIRGKWDDRFVSRSKGLIDGPCKLETAQYVLHQVVHGESPGGDEDERDNSVEYALDLINELMEEKEEA